nr:hypothetical protein GCM10017611_79320 [Rhodococcus wratislaviensis]
MGSRAISDHAAQIVTNAPNPRVSPAPTGVVSAHHDADIVTTPRNIADHPDHEFRIVIVWAVIVQAPPTLRYATGIVAMSSVALHGQAIFR